MSEPLTIAKIVLWAFVLGCSLVLAINEGSKFWEKSRLEQETQEIRDAVEKR